MRPTAPCLNCQERHGGCHDGCKRYESFTEANAAWKANILQQKTKQSLLDDYRIKSVIRQSGEKERER